jgi:hypothetical protein
VEVLDGAEIGGLEVFKVFACPDQGRLDVLLRKSARVVDVD